MNQPVTHLDCAVVGAGPAGLTAALYMARAGLRVRVFEKGVVGGQVAQSGIIENYPGFASISGGELAEAFRAHAVQAGADIDEFDTITTYDLAAHPRCRLTTQDGKCYAARAVILATGTVPRRLPVDNEAQFYGRGIHYCALCDGPVYRGKRIAVVGGGNAAVEEALYLAGLAAQVVVIRRKDSFHADRTAVARLEAASNVEIRYRTDLTAVQGGETVESVRVRNTATGREETLPVDGVFVFIGAVPGTDFLADRVPLDEEGYLITPAGHATALPGVFGAGDVRRGACRQIVTAAADGSLAALEAIRYCETHEKES